MKAIYEEDSSPEGGVPTKDMGPINEWYLSGFDGGELALIGFNTAFGEYILMEPSEAYAPFMDAVREKIYMSKLVIEFLLDEVGPSYEDLINKLQVSCFIFVLYYFNICNAQPLIKLLFLCSYRHRYLLRV